MHFRYEVISPEKVILEGAAEMVVLPGSEGDLGVLVNHAPLVSSLRAGVVRVYEGDTVTQKVFVSGGFVSVHDDHCAILVDQAMLVAELDRAIIEKNLQAAREDLLDADNDIERAEAEKTIHINEAMLVALEA